MSGPDFDFAREHDGSLSVEAAVFQSLGAVSMAWSETPKGVFDSTWAKAIGDALVAKIALGDEGPNPELAR